jgi:hypothetical protein
MWGGLGNQFYSVFATIAYALQWGLSWHFQNGNASISGGGRERPTYWSTVFDALAQSHTIEESTHENSIHLFADDHATGNFVPMPPPPTPLSSHLTVHWRMHAFAHFDERAFEIVVLLGLAAKVIDAKEALRSLVGRPLDHGISMISMHFRLGDYRELGKFILPYDYYLQALKLSVPLQTSGDPVHVVVFRELEDEYTVQKYLRKLKAAFPQVNFHFCPHEWPDWFQLLAMSACDGHIIANSSFSWWAAYLHYVSARGHLHEWWASSRTQLPVVTFPSRYDFRRVDHGRYASSSLDLFNVQHFPSAWAEIEFLDEVTSVDIEFPVHGSTVDLPVTPELHVIISDDDDAGHEVRSNPSAWHLCIEFTAQCKASTYFSRDCLNLGALPQTVPSLSADSEINLDAEHTLTVYLARSEGSDNEDNSRHRIGFAKSVFRLTA